MLYVFSNAITNAGTSSRLFSKTGVCFYNRHYSKFKLLLESLSHILNLFIKTAFWCESQLVNMLKLSIIIIFVIYYSMKFKQVINNILLIITWAGVFVQILNRNFCKQWSMLHCFDGNIYSFSRIIFSYPFFPYFCKSKKNDNHCNTCKQSTQNIKNWILQK